MSLFDKYAETLTILTGNPFEDEVCARLQTAILDFQTISTKPNGDGGLDGLSDNCTIGYCCYGPEFDSFKDEQELNSDIVKKFRSDLRKLFELRSKKEDQETNPGSVSAGPQGSPAKSPAGPPQVSATVAISTATTKIPKAGGKAKTNSTKGDLCAWTNKALEDIIPSGCKIKVIKLIVNRFESNKIYKPLYESFQTYMTKSALRFLDSSAKLVILGPKQLAAMYGVDEMTLNRAAQRVRTTRVQLAAEKVLLTDAKDFEHKINLLKEIRPSHVIQIDDLAEGWRRGWRLAIAVEQELDSTAANLHYALEQGRMALLDKINAFMFEHAEPWMHLSAAEKMAAEILQSSFQTVYGDLFPSLCHGEISRLIGECPIRWEKN